MGVGDVILDPKSHSKAFAEVKHVLKQADFVVANCDQVYSDKREDPSGFWQIHVSAPPGGAAMLDSVIDAGINVINLGNNHSLDWGYEAMFDCIDRCRNLGIVTFGFGKNLEHARRPAIVEKNGTKIGFLAYCSVGPIGYEATLDRPGHVPLRAYTHYEQWDPQPGTPPLIHTFANRGDLRRMIKDIEDLRPKVDVLTVSYHWGVHYIPALIADYQFEAAHAAIDAGADVIFGHHAHLPKGIEVYKSKPIFYSMHNFAAAGEWCPPATQPGCKYPASQTWDFTRFGRLFEERFKKLADEESRSTMIAKLLIEGGRIARVSYIPCYYDDDKNPRVVKQDEEKGQQIFEHFKRLSRSQNLDTEFQWKGDEIIILT
jgi:poly-gamma-glutamate synthesis protein (capsule biosynthesis protein)